MEESIKTPRHVAVIMDGNGRWAKKNGVSRLTGHNQGMLAMKEIIKKADMMGIKYLTVYAFSTENWKRSEEEVDYLMKLLAKHIKDFDKRIKNRDIRFRLVGDINRLNKDLQDGIIVVISYQIIVLARFGKRQFQSYRQTELGHAAFSKLDTLQ